MEKEKEQSEPESLSSNNEKNKNRLKSKQLANQGIGSDSYQTRNESDNNKMDTEEKDKKEDKQNEEEGHEEKHTKQQEFVTAEDIVQVSDKNGREVEEGELAAEEEKKNGQKTSSPEIKKRRISLTRQTSNTPPTPGTRKRKWSSASKNKSSIAINTGSLKNLIPGVQLASTPALEAVMDFEDDKEDEEMEKPREKMEPEDGTKDTGSNDTMLEEKAPVNKKSRIVHVEESKTITLNHVTEVNKENNEIMDVNQGDPHILNEGTRAEDDPTSSSTPSSETNFKANREVSPARNPPSQVVHVRNLVRPFTNNQLNQLLSKYGPLVDGGFWINKIKSHCYATYSSVEDAKVARDGLHGQRWPTTSPKILSVDFGDEEKMAEDTEGLLGKKKEATDQKEKQNAKESEKEKVREGRRHRERKEQKPKQESSAATLLDKLFRKTATVPCIYWLPLTKEQIMKKDAEREERRKQRQLALREEEKQHDERLKGQEKERETGREKPRETGRGREHDTSRDKERKPLRDSRVASPPARSRLDRRSGGKSNRSRSRSKGAGSRRDDYRRR